MEARKVAKGTLQILVTHAVQYVTLGLFYIIVAKTGALTQAELGVWSILSFLSMVLTLSTTIALPTALTKFVSEDLGKNQLGEAASVKNTITRTILILSTIGFLIMAFSSELLSQHFWDTSTYAFFIISMSGFAFLDGLILLYESYLQALFSFGKMAIVTLSCIISSRIIAATLALLHFGILGLIIGFVVGSLASLGIALIFTHGKLPNTNSTAPIRPLLSFSLPLFLGSITLLAVNQADIVVLASITSDYALVGIYSIAVRSLDVLRIVWFPLLVTILPVLSVRDSLQDLGGISNIINIATRYLSYTIFPSCVGLAVVAPTALAFFYGPSYTPGAAPLAILSITTVIFAFYSVFTTSLAAKGKTGQVLKINIISALLSVILLMTLVPFLEAVGAAFARLIVQAVGLTLAVHVLCREVRVRLDKEAIFKSFIASTATVPFLTALEWTISEKLSVIQILAIEIFGATCIYLFSLYVLRALNSEDFELLRQAFPTTLAKYLNILERIFVR